MFLPLYRHICEIDHTKRLLRQLSAPFLPNTRDKCFNPLIPKIMCARSTDFGRKNIGAQCFPPCELWEYLLIPQDFLIRSPTLCCTPIPGRSGKTDRSRSRVNLNCLYTVETISLRPTINAKSKTWNHCGRILPETRRRRGVGY